MKKILGISLVAMMAVTSARADIASKAYVDVSAAGNVVSPANTAGENIAALDAAIGELPEGSNVMAQITSAGSAIKSVKVNGSGLTPDGSGAVNVTVAEGATNGTVAVNGSDVAVHGLGSAAYTATTAYDAAGTASGLVGNLGTREVEGQQVAYPDVKTYVDEKVTAASSSASSAIDALELSTVGNGTSQVILTVGQVDGQVSATAGQITDDFIASNAGIAPSKIATDANNRFVTDTEKTGWSGKQNALGGTGNESKAVTTDSNGAVSYTDIDTTVTQGSSHLVTSGAVQTAVANAQTAAVSGLDLTNTAASGQVVIGVAQTDGQLSATMGDPLTTAGYSDVTAGTEGQGTYVLTKVVGANNQVSYAWEHIAARN